MCMCVRKKSYSDKRNLAQITSPLEEFQRSTQESRTYWKHEKELAAYLLYQILRKSLSFIQMKADYHVGIMLAWVISWLYQGSTNNHIIQGCRQRFLEKLENFHKLTVLSCHLVPDH